MKLIDAPVGSIFKVGNSGEFFKTKPGTSFKRRTGEQHNWVRDPDTGQVDYLTADTEVELVKVFEHGALPDRMAYMTGCDPEIFAVDAKEKLVPAFKYLPDKTSYSRVDGTGKPYSIVGPYYDGFQGEFPTVAQHCHEGVVGEIGQRLQDMHYKLNQFSPGGRLTLQPVFEIPKTILKKEDFKHVMLGCSPSQNAYGNMPEMPEDPREFPLRMAGGHIHFGSHPTYRVQGLKDVFYAQEIHHNAQNLVRAMDAFVGVPCVSLFEGIDDPRRRQYYGLAGEYRLPSHGLEYRTLSNAWLSSPRIAHLVLNMARGAFRLGWTQWQSQFPVDWDEVQGIINTCDVAGARGFIKRYEEVIKNLHFQEAKASGYYAKKQTTKAFKYFMTGLRDNEADWENVTKNWGLNAGVFAVAYTGRSGAWGAATPVVGAAPVGIPVAPLPPPAYVANTAAARRTRVSTAPAVVRIGV
jgi:hypothetical protein